MDIKKLNEELAHLLNENKSYFVTMDGERVSDYYNDKAAAIAWAEENYSIDDDRIAIEDCDDLDESLNEIHQSINSESTQREIANELRAGITQGDLSDGRSWSCGIDVVGQEGEDGDLGLLTKPLRDEALRNIADVVEEGNLKDILNLELNNANLDISDRLSVKDSANKYPQLIEIEGDHYYFTIRFDIIVDEDLDESYVIMYDDGEMDLDNELSLEQLIDRARCETSEEIYSEKEAIDALSKKGYKVFMMEGLNEDLAYEESLMDAFDTVRGAIETAMHNIKLESKPVNFNRITNAMTQLKLAADAYELANDPEYNGRPRNEVLKSCYNFVQEAKKHLG